MRHVSGIVLAIAALAAFGPSSRAASGASAPAEVEAFYHWYLGQAGANPPPVVSTKIGDYVTPTLLTRLRHAYSSGQFAEGTDYFLKVQDYDETDWNTHLVAVSYTHLTLPTKA